jgi:hypothetical protein
MSSILIGIVGNADANRNAIEDLITDYFVGQWDYPNFIISSAKTDGLKAVRYFLEDRDYEFDTLPSARVLSRIKGEPGDRAVMVLGTQGSEDVIKDMLDAQIPVLDLTRALYPVTYADLTSLPDAEIAPDVAEFHSESLAAAAGVTTLNTLPLDAAGFSAPQLELIREMIMVAIHVHEQEFHPSAPVKFVDNSDHEAKLDDSPSPDKVRYIRHKENNTIRKARSNSRLTANEEEIWLTPEQAEAFAN